MYFNFLSFLNTEMAKIVQIVHGRQGPVRSYRKVITLVLVTWRCVSNPWRLDCFLNSVTVLCEGHSLATGEFPHNGPVARKMFQFDDVIRTSETTATDLLLFVISATNGIKRNMNSLDLRLRNSRALRVWVHPSRGFCRYAKHTCVYMKN